MIIPTTTNSGRHDSRVSRRLALLLALVTASWLVTSLDLDRPVPAGYGRSVKQPAKTTAVSSISAGAQPLLEVATGMHATARGSAPAVAELSRLVALPPGEERFTSLRAGVAQWAGTAPLAARDWIAATIDDEHLAAQLQGVVFWSWSRSDLPGAVEGLLAIADQPNDPALIALARRWAERDPVGAEQWVELIEDAWLRAELSREMASFPPPPRS